MFAPFTTRSRLLLGDLLLRQRQLSPYQLGVALDVQRRTRLPIGEILVQAAVVSRPRLWLALFTQKLLRRVTRPLRPLPASYYGQDLPHLAKARLEQHMATFPKVPVVSFEVAEAMKLRRERAQLDRATARIVEDNDILKERLLSGNF